VLFWIAVLDQCLAWKLEIERGRDLLTYSVHCGLEITEGRSCVSVVSRFWTINIHVVGFFGV
jgi:hypothetical protein